jgi:hypothetical protein
MTPGGGGGEGGGREEGPTGGAAWSPPVSPELGNVLGLHIECVSFDITWKLGIGDEILANMTIYLPILQYRC